MAARAVGASVSRAFVKEDADNEDVVVTHRAPLPDGVPNLVTPAGLAALEQERAAKLAALEGLKAGEETGDATRRAAGLEEELLLLLERLASAKVVQPPDDGTAGVGATVLVRYQNGPQAGQTTELELVGVDEADPFEGRIAFTAPVAEALLGRRVGESVTFTAGERELTVTLERVTYPA